MIDDLFMYKYFVVQYVHCIYTINNVCYVSYMCCLCAKMKHSCRESIFYFFALLFYEGVESNFVEFTNLHVHVCVPFLYSKQFTIFTGERRGENSIRYPYPYYLIIHIELR